MAQKKTNSKKRRTTRQSKTQTKRRSINKVTLFKVLFTLLVVLGLFTLFLDWHIRQQFEGKRWALPAKVYARPLELYAGAHLSMNDLKIELRGLGYKFVSQASAPGEAAFSSTRAIITTRGFRFADGLEPARKLIVNFSGSTLSSVSNINGKALTLVRLEPILIGGIYPLDNEDRDLIQLKDAPPALIHALIAIEDRNFYHHHGISLKGIARAMWVDLRAGHFVEGGSTLTQQLVKNFYLTSKRTIWRKLIEIPMALLLELHYSKDQILQAYLNEIYLGQDGTRAIHGFGLAAHYYFAQPIQELKLPQVALLAGMVRGPSYYDPRRHPERALKRRNLVLKVMQNLGKISDRQYRKAIAAPLGVVKQGSLLNGAYPAFLDLVKRQLRKNYRDKDLRSDGLRVFTSLNPITQYKAETAMVSTLDHLNHYYGHKLDKLQGSMVVTDPQTGEVLAVVGDRHTRYQGFDRALDSRRQVGSVIKPAVYLTALEQGYTLISPIDDSPIKVKMPNGQIWEPKNFEHVSHGVVPLHVALTHSYNQATVRLGMALGVNKVIDTLRRLGITRPLDPYPSLFLGAQSFSPLEIATMYQTIAANGFQMPLRAIRTVTDSHGNALSRYPFQLKQTIKPAYIHLLQYNLQEVARSGTGKSIYQQLPSNINVAGKTGTSSEQRDSWFAGFASNRLAVVWVGLDNNDPLPFPGAGGALKVWTAFMRSEPLESLSTPTPNGVKYVWVNQTSGKLSSEGCEGAQLIPFIKGTEPTVAGACARNADNPISQSLDWLKHWFR